jgi:hypothetical protein
VLAKSAFLFLLQSPSRNFGARIWDAELARGTFNQMGDGRRSELDSLFKQANGVETYQDAIYILQGRLKTLTLTTTIS